MTGINERIGVGRTSTALEPQSQKSPLDRLTRTQLDVLRHYAQGETIEEVAKALFRTRSDVHNRKTDIFTSLGVHSIEKAVLIFLNNYKDPNFVNPFAERVNKGKVRLEDLADRQRQLFDLLAQGKSNDEITEVIGMKAAAIKNTINSISNKWLLESDLEPRVCMILIGHAMKKNNPAILAPKF